MNKIRRFLLFFSLAIGLVLPGLSNQEVIAEENLYVNEKLGFSIQGPEGWHMEKPKEWTILEAWLKNKERESEVYNLLKQFLREKCPFGFQLSFFKYPVGSVKSNPEVTLTIVNPANVIFEGTEPTVWDYVNTSLDTAKWSLKNFRFIESPKEIELNGRKAIRVEYEGIDSFTGEEYRTLGYFFLKNGICYHLSAYDEPGNFADNRKHFEEAINSFKLR